VYAVDFTLIPIDPRACKTVPPRYKLEHARDDRARSAATDAEGAAMTLFLECERVGAGKRGSRQLACAALAMSVERSSKAYRSH